MGCSASSCSCPASKRRAKRGTLAYGCSKAGVAARPSWQLDRVGARPGSAESVKSREEEEEKEVLDFLRSPAGSRLVQVRA